MTHHRKGQGETVSARNSRRLTDKQRAIVEMRKTASRRETAERFNVPVSQVTWAESIFHWNMEGEAKLTADPESLEGLSSTGAISKGLADCLTGFCGSAEELKSVPDHEDYERISDVLRAGAKVVRHRWAMGPARWAEWLAFMQSRGLEWGKPLSELPNAPAKPLGQHWNVLEFPSGDSRAPALSRNAQIRRRMVAMYREAECLQRLLTALVGDSKSLMPWFVSLHVGIDGIWKEMKKAGVLAND
jgi:hypothetical protein